MKTSDIIKYINNRRNKQYIKNLYDENCISNTCHGVNYFDVSEIVARELLTNLEYVKCGNYCRLNLQGSNLAKELINKTGITKFTIRNWIIKYENVYLKRKERKISAGLTLFF